ncbi:hypothetical protein ANN_11125 [Periplaneta americana]|uniref:Uncharacterized protein n=1 Tax=Periplaneta americana TaxID=6978 RepID=A0ABQ8T5J8_PERAM|nr:hypothetical protein ANN_11125 [Periplaneta americana]
MSPGSSTDSYPAFARNGLRENPGKTPKHVTFPDRESNPGHLVSRSDALTVTPQVWTPACSLQVICNRVGADPSPWFGGRRQLFRACRRNCAVSIGTKLPQLLSTRSRRPRGTENEVLRKIFGVKRDEVTGESKKLHNAELHALYSSPDIIRNVKSRRLRWAGHVARMGESRNAYRVLVGRPEEKRPLGRPRRRWEDNIKMDLREMGYDDREWINLAQDRDRWWAYVRAAMNFREEKKEFAGSLEGMVNGSSEQKKISDDRRQRSASDVFARAPSSS